MNYRAAIIIVLLVLIGAAAAGGTYLMQPPLRPDPETAAREAILEYLVVNDLAAEPYPYQERMVDRVVAELAAKPLASNTNRKIPKAYFEQVEQNLQTLKQVWFRSRGLRYHTIPAGERNAFLDQQIEAVLAWSRADLQLNGDQAGSPKHGLPQRKPTNLICSLPQCGTRSSVGSRRGAWKRSRWERGRN